MYPACPRQPRPSRRHGICRRYCRRSAKLGVHLDDVQGRDAAEVLMTRFEDESHACIRVNIGAASYSVELISAGADSPHVRVTSTHPAATATADSVRNSRPRQRKPSSTLQIDDTLVLLSRSNTDTGNGCSAPQPPGNVRSSFSAPITARKGGVAIADRTADRQGR